MSDIRLILDLGDTHCGSSVGLLPPGFVVQEQNEVRQNAIQKWLWECWTDCTERWLPEVVGDSPFALVIKGDIVEGIHHGTKQLISPEKKDHYAAAVEVLKPIAERAAKVFVIEGTECHSGNDEHSLAKDLKAQECEVVADPNTGKAAWEKLYLTCAGVRCVFQHHISATVREYLRASMLSIFLGNEQIAAVNNGELPPRVLSCAHRHAFDEYRSDNALCYVTPPWQVKTRHANKVVTAARTKPGAVILDWRECDDGELPRLHSRGYRAPQMQDAVI